MFHAEKKKKSYLGINQRGKITEFLNRFQKTFAQKYNNENSNSSQLSVVDYLLYN